MALPGHIRSMKMAAAFGESEDAGGDARAPSLGPRSPIGVEDRLRGDDASSLEGCSRGYSHSNDDMRLSGQWKGPGLYCDCIDTPHLRC